MLRRKIYIIANVSSKNAKQVSNKGVRIIDNNTDSTDNLNTEDGYSLYLVAGTEG